MKLRLSMLAVIILFTFACDEKTGNDKLNLNEQVADYIQKFPYQDTYNYMKKYTSGNPSKLNVWVLGEEPVLVKAGEDKVVRMNNDTYYKLAFVELSRGPVKLSSSNPPNDRFYSFQLMDDRNVNYRNVIRPKGNYFLYNGSKPEILDGELIEVPSKIGVVIVRVEVKDKNNEDDVNRAKSIFNGITIEGPKIKEFPQIDLLSSFSKEVADEANRLMDSTIQNTPFSQLIAGPGQVPDEVSYLRLSAGTKGGWGGPVTSHSVYEFAFVDKQGEALNGSKGDYKLTMKEPPVDAFWSVTVYDTDSGGFFHPNKDDRYHINNTTAVKNNDGTITFYFRTKCKEGDVNCLEVPSGKFDLVARYYLPHEEIRNGKWTLPKPELIKN